MVKEETYQGYGATSQLVSKLEVIKLDDPVCVKVLLQEAGVPPVARKLMADPLVKLWRLPDGLMSFVLGWAGLKGDDLTRCQQEVGRALDSLGERRQTDLRRNSGQGTVPHEDRIKSVFKLLYNNMLGDGEKSYVLSFCQPSGSGTAASVAELADLTADEWEAAYLRTLHNRPGGCYSEDDVIASMLALATALQVTIDVGTLDQSNPRLEKVLTRAMHARGLEEIHREDKRRGRARSMSEQEAWEKLCAEIGFGVPTIRDVTEAVQELCGSVLWHLEGTEAIEKCHFSSSVEPYWWAGPPSNVAEILADPLRQYFALRGALQVWLRARLEGCFWVVAGKTRRFSEVDDHPNEQDLSKGFLGDRRWYHRCVMLTDSDDAAK